MLKFTARKGDTGETVYFIGTARENINRLTEGDPIRFNLADMGGPDAEVVILFGETMRSLYESLQHAGLIPKNVPFIEPTRGMAQVVRFKHDDDPSNPT